MYSSLARQIFGNPDYGQAIEEIRAGARQGMAMEREQRRVECSARAPFGRGLSTVEYFESTRARSAGMFSPSLPSKLLVVTQTWTNDLGFL